MTEIDKVTVINLDRALDRFATFSRLNGHLPLERFSGVDGYLLDRWDIVDEGLITPGNPYGLGSLGSSVSHLRLWQRCAAGTSVAHIAEDDAVFRHDFLSRASASLASLKDWDIMLWAWNFDWPLEVSLDDGLGTTILKCNEAALRAEWAAFQASRSTPTILRLIANTGLCAYSLSPSGAKRLLQCMLPIAGKASVYPGEPGTPLANRTLDVEMTRHYASLKAYVSIPCLAISLNFKTPPVN